MALVGSVSFQSPTLFEALRSQKTNAGWNVKAEDGVGVVVLKRLKKAIEDNDNIYAFIPHRSWDPEIQDNIISTKAFFKSILNVSTAPSELVKPYQNVTSLSPARRYEVLTWSANTKESLDKVCSDHADSFNDQRSSLADVAFTLQTCRQRLRYRRALVCEHLDEASNAVFDKKFFDYDSVNANKEPVAFLFPGQGTQYLRLCHGLFEEEPVFRKSVEECLSIIGRHYSTEDFYRVIYPIAGDDETLINSTKYTQPVLFVIEYSLAQLLKSCGIVPSIMIGHSVGEYVAACLAGVFSLSDALKLVIRRGELMESLERGLMLAVTIDENEIKQLLAANKDVDLAVVNSPSSVVVSGETLAIKNFQSKLTALDYNSVVLHTSHAFHSRMMDVILQKFEETFVTICIHEPRIPYISNLTGDVALYHDIKDPSYWSRHLRSTVQFSKGIDTLAATSIRTWIEVGPGRSLSTYSKENNHVGKDTTIFNLCRHAKHDVHDQKYFLETLGRLWCRGVDVDWFQYHQNEVRKKVSLPVYRFQRTKFPLELKPSSAHNVAIKAMDVSDWIYIPAWKKLLPPVKNQNSANKRTLFLADSDEISKQLLERFTSVNEDAVTVKVGTIDDDEDCRQLFVGLAGNLPYRIIYSACGSNSSQYIHFERCLRLIKSMLSVPNCLVQEFYLVTNDLYIITGEEETSPAQSLPVGLLKVFSQEHPSVYFSHIDLSLNGGKGFPIDLLYQTISEEGRKDSVISIRMTVRWKQSFDKIDIKPGKTKLKQNGIYLITGGLGGLGSVLAEYLVADYNASLVLTGRRKIDDLPTDHKDVIQFNKLCSRAGRERVIYQSCDVSDTASFHYAVKQSEAAFGRIDGVFHFAGVIVSELKSIQSLEMEEAARQFRPKVNGIQVLKSELADKDLDFCFIASSVSSVLGGLGFGAYAPANLYLDHFITANREQGLLQNWISVNLDGVTLDETSRGNSLDRTEFINVIETTLSVVQFPQLIVSKTDLNKRIDAWINKTANKRGTDADPKIQNEQDIDNVMRSIWQGFFDSTAIRSESDFFEIGGDSLKAVTIIGRIHKQLGAEISVKEFFENPRLKNIADIVRRKKASRYQPVPFAPKKPTYKLSSSQRRLFFLHEFDKQSLVYNLPQIVQIDGDLDREKVGTAFASLIDRHEILRTSIVMTPEGPVQKISDKIEFNVEFFVCDASDVESTINLFVRPFSLDKAPLIRAGLIEVSSLRHIMMIDFHHIITDGVSTSIYISDFMAVYSSVALKPLSIQFKDFAEWQGQPARRDKLNEQKQFWLNELGGTLPKLALPLDFQRPPVKSHEGSLIKFEVSPELTSQLMKACEHESVTLFMMTLAAYYILMARITNQDDVVVGIPVAGREQPDLEDVPGMLVNTIVIRARPIGSLTSAEFIQSVKSKTLTCYDNQLFPYEDLVEALGVPRDTSRNPVFDTMFVFQNFEEAGLTLPGLKISPYPSKHRVSKFDLTFAVAQAPDRLFMNFEYNTSLFKRETVERFVQYFNAILESLVTDRSSKINEIEILPTAEKELLLNSFNKTTANYNLETTVLALFEQQVKKTPERIAVRYQDFTLTYSDVDSIANKLACYLHYERGITRGHLVGLKLDRDALLIPVIFGILKTGAAYLPIDIRNPADRVRTIVKDANVEFVVSTKKYSAPDIPVSFICIDEVWKAVNKQAISKIPTPPGSEDLAYVIYTSGSSGTPKGVMIKHRSVLNVVQYLQQQYPLLADDCFLFKTAHSFDVSVAEIFGWFLEGGSVAVLPAGEEANPWAIFKTIVDQKVTHVNFVPSMFGIFIRGAEVANTPAFDYIKYFLLAGEVLPRDLMDRYRKMNAQPLLENLYGPTETTIYCSGYSTAQAKDDLINIPIGKPMANTRFYVVNSANHLQPIGVAGELCIAGEALAKGYLNNDKLTNEKFVFNEVVNERVYRSGDLVRWLADGNIEFLGRIDSQVKVHGYRIELGEIEHQLSSYDGIQDTVAVIKSDKSDSFVVAYYVADQPIPTGLLRSFLSKNLPEYMIPSFFMKIDKIPLNANGKVDRSKMPDVNTDSTEVFVAPTEEIHYQMAAIWSEVLGVETEKISINRSFFEMGGNSLKLVSLVSSINQKLGWKLAIPTVFRYPTIESLTATAFSKADDIDRFKDTIKEEADEMKDLIQMLD
jgi:amino acid adenylation domain-containing protein